MDNLIIFLSNFSESIVKFYHSGFFAVIKFLLGIYAAVVLVDIILLLAQRGMSGDIKQTLTGMNVPIELTKRQGKLRKKWKKIKDVIKTGDEKAYKIAIIKMDEIIDDLIKRMGYGGENMGERLAAINPGQIENISELQKAHELRNKIIHEENFKLEKEQAEEAIGYYENFLKYYEVLK